MFPKCINSKIISPLRPLLRSVYSQQTDGTVKNCNAVVETAPSFEQISQSITDLLTDPAVDDGAAAESTDEVFTSASLSAEYQQISTWCWVNIRVCCGALLSIHYVSKKCSHL